MIWNIQKKANNLSEVLFAIMESKNLNKEEIREFIDSPFELHDPYLFKDMKLVIEKINKAINENKKIYIIGD